VKQNHHEPTMFENGLVTRPQDYNVKTLKEFNVEVKRLVAMAIPCGFFLFTTLHTVLQEKCVKTILCNDLKIKYSLALSNYFLLPNEIVFEAKRPNSF
jgi:hypothetical protein